MPSAPKKPATESAAPQPTTAPASPAAPTNQLALWSMISGIVSLTIGWFIPVPTGIAAVVLGHIGLSQIKKSGAAGRQFALTGLILGYASIAIGIIIAAVLALFFGAMFFGIFNGYTGYTGYGMMHP